MILDGHLLFFVFQFEISIVFLDGGVANLVNYRVSGVFGLAAL